MAVNNVVLVHGAWANGSAWGSVILELEKQKLKQSAVQLPLTSFADDLAATRRVLAPQGGPTLLVGHSYGGVVLTEDGNAPNVAALAYVAAFAPEEGHVMVDDVNQDPAPGLAASILTVTAFCGSIGRSSANTSPRTSSRRRRESWERRRSPCTSGASRRAVSKRRRGSAADVLSDRRP